MNKYRQEYKKKKFKECPFCVWLKKYKNDVIEETENYYLTINHYPYIHHHLLIAPKKHVTRLIDEKFVDEKEYLTQQAGKIFLKLGVKNYVVLDRSGHKSGRSLKHVHRHVIPVNGPHDMYYRYDEIDGDLDLQGDVKMYRQIIEKNN